jgi:primase-polymerase (primpol)-like protein
VNSYHSIPQQLKDLPNWVCWKLETLNGQLTKIPYNPKTGLNAKADTPATWGTFQQACDAVDVLSGNDYDGIGFELLGTHLAGIDFDNALINDGVSDSYALAILKLLGSPYTETSPSSTGLHTFIECDSLPKGKRKLSQDHTGIEIYHGQEKGRFFTITGKQFSGDGIPKIDDISLPYLLITQNRNVAFKALWLGDTTAQGGDDSNADFALMCRLAVLTQNDVAKMEKFFGFSGLGQRDKWRDREGYRQSTIKAAIETNHVKVPGQPAALEFHSPAVPDPDGDYVIGAVEGRENLL